MVRNVSRKRLNRK